MIHAGDALRRDCGGKGEGAEQGRGFKRHPASADPTGSSKAEKALQSLVGLEANELDFCICQTMLKDHSRGVNLPALLALVTKGKVSVEGRRQRP